MAKTVFRCDNMPGIDNRAYTKSVLVTDGSDPIEVENGTIVKIGNLVEGQRDLWEATIAGASDKLEDCAIIGTPEVPYDEINHKNLDDFVNEAGVPAAAYLLGHGGCFSVTKDGFTGGTAPAVKDAVALGADGKIEKTGSGTALGTCISVDKVGRYTFYAIEM